MICKGLEVDRVSLLDQVGEFLWTVPLLASSHVCVTDLVTCFQLYMLDAKVFCLLIRDT